MKWRIWDMIDKSKFFFLDLIIFGLSFLLFFWLLAILLFLFFFLFFDLLLLFLLEILRLGLSLEHEVLFLDDISCLDQVFVVNDRVFVQLQRIELGVEVFDVILGSSDVFGQSTYLIVGDPSFSLLDFSRQLSVFVDYLQGSLVDVLSLSMFDDSFLNLLDGRMELLILFLVIIRDVARSLLIPGCLFFCKSLDPLNLALSSVFQKFLVFDLLFNFVDQSLKPVFGFS